MLKKIDNSDVSVFIEVKQATIHGGTLKEVPKRRVTLKEGKGQKLTTLNQNYTS